MPREGQLLDQDWRVLALNRLADAELSVRVGAHGVHIVVLGDEARVLGAAGHFSDRDVVGAKARNGVVLLLGGVFTLVSRWHAQAELAPRVTAPGEDLGVEGFLLRVDV